MIGILGGTFDPVHLGHIHLAIQMVEALQLSELKLMPSYLPPHRPPPIATALHRYQMLKLAIANCAKLRVDDREIQRQGISYSVDSLTSVRSELGATLSLGLILGLDAFNHLNTWKDWQKLLNLCHLIVVNRPGYGLNQDMWMQDLLAQHLVKELKELHSRPSGCIFFYQVKPMEESATAIRKKLATNPATMPELSPQVFHYIQSNQLYGLL